MARVCLHPSASASFRGASATMSRVGGRALRMVSNTLDVRSGRLKTMTATGVRSVVAADSMVSESPRAIVSLRAPPLHANHDRAPHPAWQQGQEPAQCKRLVPRLLEVLLRVDDRQQ